MYYRSGSRIDSGYSSTEQPYAATLRKDYSLQEYVIRTLLSLGPKYLTKIHMSDEFARQLLLGKLWPVAPGFEQNWSGRGQHARFAKHERNIINETLQFHDTLGTTATAKVESVKCRRVMLARKSISCRRGVKREAMLEEVAHLNKLQHSHIVRIIGTYVYGTELAILLYPVAEYNLEAFLEKTRERRNKTMIEACARFSSCLNGALDFIHARSTKHMDIKPQNILVKRVSSEDSHFATAYIPLIADFGIARSYDSRQAAETDGVTAFTRKYAASEVVQQETRGLPADIFSLGCVFLEIKLTLCYDILTQPRPWDQVQSLLLKNPNHDMSYQANLAALTALLIDGKALDPLTTIDQLRLERFWMPPRLIFKMMEAEPSKRPSTTFLSKWLTPHPCCKEYPLALRTIERDACESSEEESGTDT